MIDMQLEIFLLIAIGYLLTKLNMFTKATRKQLTDIVLGLVLPAATINSFMIKLTPEILSTTFVVFCISIAIQFLYMLFNAFLYKNVDEDKRINLKYGTMVSNAGFMGMPISQVIFGNTGLLYASIFLIPQRIFMWSAGLSMYTSTDRKTMIKSVATHPCIIAIYIGIVCMALTSFGFVFPVFITKTLSAVGSCNTALSMFVIGGILSDVDRSEFIDKDCLQYSLVRLIILPLVILLALKWTPLNATGVGVCVVLSAMPAATTTAMLAAKYNRNPEFASKMIFVSTLLSLVTLPIISFLISL